MKEVIIIAKCLLVMLLLSSCAATDQYITIVNRSVKPIEVSYKVADTKEGVFWTAPKHTDADTNKLDSKKFELIKDLNSNPLEVSIQLPAGKVLIIGAFEKSDLAGDPLLINFKGERYNLTNIKVSSESGEVEKDHEDSKGIFRYDQDGNYRILILN